MKQFEIPYNFDYNLISALWKLNISNLCHCIYIPPYQEDYISAKYYYLHHNGQDMFKNNQMDRKEYENHISYIKAHFPNKLMLLLQQNDICITKEILTYYYNLGFRKFCVGSVSQAQQIRNLYSNVEIIGSITMKISPQMLNQSQYEIFDGFVLWFPYNRNLPVIKTLPNKYKYILLVNCDCSIYCKGSHHWFATQDEESVIKCPNNKIWENTIRIDSQDLTLFESYITYFKLQGREYTTPQILEDLLTYSNMSNILPPNPEYIYFNPDTERMLNE